MPLVRSDFPSQTATEGWKLKKIEIENCLQRFRVKDHQELLLASRQNDTRQILTEAFRPECRPTAYTELVNVIMLDGQPLSFVENDAVSWSNVMEQLHSSITDVRQYISIR